MTAFPSARFLDRTTPPHLVTLILLAGMSAMVMNVFLPSLPGMAAYFETDYRLIQLSVPVYLATSAVLQLFIGPLSDKFGRRPVILWGLALFLLATVGCLLAPNVETFLVFRMLQALIAVGMVLSRAVVRDLFDQDQSASMIGYVTMGMAVVPMISPVIGGVLDEFFGWKASFWLLLGLGGALMALVWADQGETVTSRGLTVLEQFREYPELLASPRFWGYSVTAALCSGAFFAYLGGAPFVGSEVFGMSPAELGVYFGAPAIGYFAGNFLTGRYAVRFGVNRMTLWGCIIAAAGCAASLIVFLFGAGTAFSFFAFMTFVGVGNGLTIPNATGGLLSVRPHLAGTASGLGGAIMLAGGAALGALAGAVLTPASGAFPLLYIMFFTTALSCVSIALTIRRERRLAAQPG